MKEMLAVLNLDIAATVVPLTDFNLTFWHQVASLSLSLVIRHTLSHTNIYDFFS